MEHQSIGSCHNLIQLSLDDKLLTSQTELSWRESVSTSRQLPALNCAVDKSGFDPNHLLPLIYLNAVDFTDGFPANFNLGSVVLNHVLPQSDDRILFIFFFFSLFF